MTYGWAILIILISLGAMFYLGVFTPNVPNNCLLQPPFTCMDVVGFDANAQATLEGDADGYIILNIGVGSASNVNLENVEVDGIDCGYISVNTAGLTSLNSGEHNYIYCRVEDRGDELESAPTFNAGDRFSGKIMLSYSSAYGSLPHNIEGTFSGVVEGGYCFTPAEDCIAGDLLGCATGASCSNEICSYLTCAPPSP